ncbi:MAG: YabP/YqfC family sporulation protein [Angelakisella sp.]
MNKAIRPKALVKAVGNTVSIRSAAMVPQLRIELLQNRQAVVEGCKGVLEYSDCCIRLSGDKTIVRFCGSGLALRTFSSNAAIVEGSITSVDFS